MTSLRITPRLRALALLRAVPLLAVSLLAALVATAPRAAASSPLRPGLGYRVAGGDFVGFYRDAAGTEMYCIDPRKAAPQSVSLHTVGSVRGLSAAVTRQLGFALHHWGTARTAAQAAVESQVLNTLAGNAADVRRRGHALPARLRRIVTDHVRLARADAGPYSVRVRMPALTPGASGTGTVTVTSGSRHGVAGVPVRLTGTANVAVPRWLRTSASGSARFTYRVTSVGEVRVSATATGLPIAQVRATAPPRGIQRMVAGAGVTSAHGAVAFEKRLSGFTHAYSCTTTCDGHPAARLSACAPASSLTSRITYRTGTSVIGWTFAPARARTCHTISTTLADGEHVTATWQYRTPKGWSAPVAAGGTFTVDCPAAPAVSVVMTYSCQAVTLRVSLADDSAVSGAASPTSGTTATGQSVWVNRSRHAMVLVIGGDEPRRIVAAPGHSAVFTATRTCADPSEFTVQAGVQRAGGGWNYGEVATVRTPGKRV